MIDGDDLIRYLQDYKYSFANSKTAREFNVLQNVRNFVLQMMADTEGESDNTTTYVLTEISLADAWYKCSKCGYNHYAVCAEPDLNYCHGCGRLIAKTDHKEIVSCQEQNDFISGHRLTNTESQQIILNEIDRALSLPDNFEKIMKPFRKDVDHNKP